MTKTEKKRKRNDLEEKDNEKIQREEDEEKEAAMEGKETKKGENRKIKSVQGFGTEDYSVVNKNMWKDAGTYLENRKRTRE